MKVYQIVGLALLIVILVIVAAVSTGLLPESELPFALTVVLIVGALLLVYARIRLKGD